MAKRGKGKSKKGQLVRTQVVSGAPLSSALDAKHRRSEALKAEAAALRQAAKAKGASREEALALRAEARQLQTQAVALDVELVEGHEAAMARAAVTAGVKERVGLEALRIGKPVELVKERHVGAEVKRISDVDGLVAMKLDPDLRQAGMAYRDLVRTADPRWSSSLSGIDGGGRSSLNTWSMVAARARQAQRQRVLRDLDVRISRAPGMTPDHLRVLKAIAGEGQTMSQYAGGGGRRSAACAKRLKEILAVVHALLTPPAGSIQVVHFGPP